MFGKVFDTSDKYVFVNFALGHSMDDKAYVRPGTSEGFSNSRRLKILTLAGDGAHHLPKNNWPEKLVYQTPAAHRIMTKS